VSSREWRISFRGLLSSGSRQPPTQYYLVGSTKSADITQSRIGEGIREPQRSQSSHNGKTALCSLVNCSYCDCMRSMSVLRCAFSEPSPCLCVFIFSKECLWLHVPVVKQFALKSHSDEEVARRSVGTICRARHSVQVFVWKDIGPLL
jgi:hypothetical protein